MTVERHMKGADITAANRRKAVNSRKTMQREEKKIVEKWEKGRLCPFPGILEALGVCPDAAERISVAGAGGKTSLIKALVEEYNARNLPAAVTTTTHMYAEEKPYFLLEPSEEKMIQILNREGKIFLGKKAGAGKMQMPDEVWMEKLLQLSCPVLIEADGARHMPLKVPGEQEPVFRKETGRILYVYGMDAIGSPLEEVCFRAEEAARILGKKMGEPVLPWDIARLAMHQRGGAKGVNKAVKYALIFNKTDLPGKKEAAREICEILQECGYENPILCLGNLDRRYTQELPSEGRGEHRKR